MFPLTKHTSIAIYLKKILKMITVDLNITPFPKKINYFQFFYDLKV